VNTVQFNEDSSVVISGSIDGTVRCWDVRSKRYEPIQVSCHHISKKQMIVPSYLILTGYIAFQISHLT